MEKVLNKKNLDLMLTKIDVYKKNKVQLRTLIDDLESLLNLLANIDEKWIDKFLSYWNTLEIIFSINLVENKTVTKIETIKIKNCLISLENLIMQQINFLSSHKIS